MSHSTRFQVVAVLVVGALLGYAAATGSVLAPTSALLATNWVRR